MSAPDGENPDEPEINAPHGLDAKGRPRIAPKLGLKGQVRFITDLRLRAKMMDGADATEAWLLLEPVDLERLDDLAEGLDILVMDTEDRRVKSKWKNSK